MRPAMKRLPSARTGPVLCFDREVASLAAGGGKPPVRPLQRVGGFFSVIRKMKATERVLAFIALALFLFFVILGMQNFVWVGGVQYDTPIVFDEK